MAQIRLLAWNIQVYGQTKFEETANRYLIVELIAKAIARLDVNMVLLMEIKDYLAEQICTEIRNQVGALTHRAWQLYTVSANLTSDYEDPPEAYGILYRTDAGFNVTANAPGFVNVALSENDFPSNVSPAHGRRAAVATFRTADTGVNFTVSVYHAPPGANQARQGLEPLARTRALYSVSNNGVQQNVTGRLLAGDYNLNYDPGNPYPEFSWLTQAPPPPPQPPPAGGQNGAGTAPVINSTAAGRYTHYITVEEAVRRWGQDVNRWSQDPVAYRDRQIDNIFFCSPNPAHRAVGQVVDLVDDIKTVTGELGLRQIAQQFQLFDNGLPTFPNVDYIDTPLNFSLTFTRNAWLLYRYAISDHLPVSITITM